MLYAAHSSASNYSHASHLRAALNLSTFTCGALITSSNKHCPNVSVHSLASFVYCWWRRRYYLCRGDDNRVTSPVAVYLRERFALLRVSWLAARRSGTHCVRVLTSLRERRTGADGTTSTTRLVAAARGRRGAAFAARTRAPSSFAHPGESMRLLRHFNKTLLFVFKSRCKK